MLLSQQLIHNKKNLVFSYIETGLYSADPEIFSLYAELVEDKKLHSNFFPVILKEFRESQEMLAELREGNIEDKRPGMIETIRLRNKGLIVLHNTQIRLLKKWRMQTDDEKLLNELLLTVNAIASGLRTTG